VGQAGPGAQHRQTQVMVREMLAEELGEIDAWIEPLLHASER